MIRVGIDPGSPYAAEMVEPIKNIISVFNNLTVTTGNLISGGDNDIPSHAFDFESVALHEMGHALGLAHPNLATESNLPGSNQNYTKSTTGNNGGYDLNPGTDGVIGSADDIRGDDVNLHWFKRSDNDPFTLGGTVDATTYSRDLTDLPSGDSFAANGDRDVANALGYSDTEAVMQQGTNNEETQRTLVADDVATLRLACAGLDETEGTADDYTINLVYAGLTTNADMVIDFDSSQTSFAVTNLRRRAGGRHEPRHHHKSGHVLQHRHKLVFQCGARRNRKTPDRRPGAESPAHAARNPHGHYPGSIAGDRPRQHLPGRLYPDRLRRRRLHPQRRHHHPRRRFQRSLSVPVTVNDGILDSDAFYLAVSVYDVVYVEPNAGCGGNTPCYATLQAGVDDVAARAAGVSVEIKAASMPPTRKRWFSTPTPKSPSMGDGPRISASRRKPPSRSTPESVP